MIKSLCSDIKNHWESGKQPFVFSEDYHFSKVKISFDKFEDTETIFVIMIELSRPDGHKSQQDVAMGTKTQMDQLLSSSDFQLLIQKRLENLHEAIEEMYD